MKPFQLILRYTRKYSLQLSLTVISMLLLVGVQLTIPWIIKTLIQIATDPAGTPNSYQLITTLTLGAFGIFILRGVFQFTRSYVAHVAGWGVVANLRKHLYEHMQRLSLRFYEDKQIGQLMSQLVNDSDLFETLIAHAIPDVFVNLLTLVGVIMVLGNINWQLLLLSLAPVPLVILALRVYAKYVRPAFRFRQQELGDLNALLNENIAGIREIKAFTREEDELNRVGVRIDNYRNSLLKALRLMAIFSPFIEFTSSLGQLVVIFFGGRLAYQGILKVSDLVAFFLYLEILYQPIRSLSGAWENVQNALAGADRISELLDEDEEVHQDQKHAIALPEPVQGAITFRDVSFSYIDSEIVLEGINLKILAHHVVALVGPTGVGKSTLVSLIPRFYEVSQGAISLDGQDIRKIKLENLRQQISIVLQDVYLFYGSVRENILFGRPDADEYDVIEAAKIANAHEFILTLPDGYNTMVGERGVKLSGGQKQRISIARAILKDAPILILDEATSSVDTETELLIQQALERLISGRTTIVIAHRLSTIRNADTIVVLEGSQIKEIGTHEELIAIDGLYKRLYSVQQRVDREFEMAIIEE
ncbi:MAG: ABC transporter ATP-binding protein/permease [Chloroflexi bacterium]|nr:ABC transporter ATP-binding protein/permease [Chloroflexota bacterium]